MMMCNDAFFLYNEEEEDDCENGMDFYGGSSIQHWTGKRSPLLGPCHLPIFSSSTCSAALTVVETLGAMMRWTKSDSEADEYLLSLFDLRARLRLPA